LFRAPSASRSLWHPAPATPSASRTAAPGVLQGAPAGGPGTSEAHALVEFGEPVRVCVGLAEVASRVQRRRPGPRWRPALAERLELSSMCSQFCSSATAQLSAARAPPSSSSSALHAPSAASMSAWALEIRVAGRQFIPSSSSGASFTTSATY
jgi:hypothetical protein